MIPDDLDSWIFGDAGNWSAELAALVETVRPEFERWFVEGGEAGMDRLHAAASFMVSNPEIQTQLDAYTFKFAAQVGGTFAQDLRDTLKEGLDSGESAAQLRKRVIAAGHGTISDYKAAMIARRESVNALNMGAHEAYRQQGVPATVWRSGPSACEFCIALDGKVISIDSTFANVGDTVNVDVDGKQRAFKVGYENVSHPPLHPFCRCSADPVELEDLQEARAAAPADPVTPGGLTPEPKPPKPPAPKPTTEWAPAKTTADAEAWLKTHKGITADYSKADVGLANLINRVLSTVPHINKDGRSIIWNIRPITKKRRCLFQTVLTEREFIPGLPKARIIDIEYEVRTLGDLQEAVSKMVEQAFTKGITAEGTVLHEYAHALDYAAGKEGWDALGLTAKFTAAYEQRIAELGPGSQVSINQGIRDVIGDYGGFGHLGAGPEETFAELWRYHRQYGLPDSLGWARTIIEESI